jgi:chemotaxis protein MotA
MVFAIAGILIAAIEEGASLGSLVAPTAMLIIVTGTIGATTACYTFKEMLSLFAVTRKAFQKPSIEMSEIFDFFGQVATVARRDGLLALESYPIKVENSLLKRGIRLLVDGTDPHLLKDLLVTQLAMAEQKTKVYAGMWGAAGGFAPTMGIIGTVIGLVNVLGNLSDAARLGPAIAVAFLATLYGIGSANIFCLPLGKKLGNVAKAETQIGLIIIEGIVSIQAGDNPRMVQEKLLSYIDETQWDALRAGMGSAK